MTGILADNDVSGHVAIIIGTLQSDAWREVWASLDLRVMSFSDLALADDAPDSLIWQACQRHELVLITANRNRHDPDSLTAIIQALNTEQSLPVFTIANPKRMVKSKTYAERVAVQLLEYLLDIDRLRGTGRMFLP